LRPRAKPWPPRSSTRCSSLPWQQNLPWQGAGGHELSHTISFAGSCAPCFYSRGWAQQHSSKAAHRQSQQSSQARQAANQAESGPEEELEEASREAAGEDATAEFKHSATVRWLAGITGLTPFAAYWVFVALNFAVIVVLLVLVAKSKVPAAFRARTQSIQRQIAEARQASEEARRRLGEIESRLAKLDSEIAAMAAAAESESRKEEGRMHAAAEEDKRKIVEAAEQEIAAAARLARSQLRAYVSELAVTLAEKQIQVSAATDQELVRAFVDQLGNNRK
jgi:F-type H+-transporting ATPase subunit b